MQKDSNLLYYQESCFNSYKYIEKESVDLFFCDPPYFISGKKGNGKNNKPNLISGDRYDWDAQWKSKEEFYDWTRDWMVLMFTQLKSTGSAYVCICWQHSGKFQELLESVGFKIHNRITWKRDKGRGSNRNWKSMHEDIWFVSKTNKYTFNVDDVLVEKPVIAPYRDAEGNPKGWFIDEKGNKVRYTKPGNIWIDFTVPFWSMKEVRSYAKTKRSPKNTLVKHNTQKPKLLVERCITASSNKGDLVVDYFSGSGTTAIAALSLKRKALVFDLNELCIKMLEARMVVELAAKDLFK